MESLLKVLRRQQTLTDEKHIMSVIHATESGTVFDPPSLRLFARTECGADNPTYNWAKCMWKHLSMLKPNECTDLVDASPSHEEEVPHTPLPMSMVEMTQAMKNLMYKETSLPVVCTTTKLNRRREAEYDRNDWFLTNASDRMSLVSEERNRLESRLCVGCMHTRTGLKYVTWLKRRDIAVFKELVNTGRIVLNRHATDAIRKGDVFVDMTIVDDDVGQLRERDVMDNLYYMESHMGRLGSRHPRGLNLTEANHMLHRSLCMFGGDWGALETYGKWEKSEQKLVDTTGALAEAVRDVIQSKKGLAKSNVGDEEILAAMRVKVNEKLEEVQVRLNDTRSRFKHTQKHRVDMNRAVVENMADCVLHDRPVPTKVSSIRKDLALLPNFIGQVEEDAKRVLHMTEARALQILGLSVLPVSRSAIKAAWNTTQKLRHTDKTLGRVTLDHEFADTISCARDFLMDLCVEEGAVCRVSPIQEAINSIKVDIFC